MKHLPKKINCSRSHFFSNTNINNLYTIKVQNRFEALTKDNEKQRLSDPLYNRIISDQPKDYSKDFQ